MRAVLVVAVFLFVGEVLAATDINESLIDRENKRRREEKEMNRSGRNRDSSPSRNEYDRRRAEAERLNVKEEAARNKAKITAEAGDRSRIRQVKESILRLENENETIRQTLLALPSSSIRRITPSELQKLTTEHLRRRNEADSSNNALLCKKVEEELDRDCLGSIFCGRLYVNDVDISGNVRGYNIRAEDIRNPQDAESIGGRWLIMVRLKELPQKLEELKSGDLFTFTGAITSIIVREHGLRDRNGQECLYPVVDINMVGRGVYESRSRLDKPTKITDEQKKSEEQRKREEELRIRKITDDDLEMIGNALKIISSKPD